MLRFFYVQIKKEDEEEWSPKSSPYLTLKGAEGHAAGMQEIAKINNYKIEYIITDETNIQVKKG
jgi:hypothetical protein